MLLRGVVILALVPFFLSIGACGSTPTPTAPQPAVPSCETNHTATVRFENRSPRTTLDVLWDGSKVATVSAGQTTGYRDVNAGIHTLLFTVTNSSDWACTPSTPNVAQCSSHTYSCSY